MLGILCLNHIQKILYFSKIQAGKDILAYKATVIDFAIPLLQQFDSFIWASVVGTWWKKNQDHLIIC